MYELRTYMENIIIFRGINVFLFSKRGINKEALDLYCGWFLENEHCLIFQDKSYELLKEL
jgi:hypothetical protein